MHSITEFLRKRSGRSKCSILNACDDLLHNTCVNLLHTVYVEIEERKDDVGELSALKLIYARFQIFGMYKNATVKLPVNLLLSSRQALSATNPAYS